LPGLWLFWEALIVVRPLVPQVSWDSCLAFWLFREELTDVRTLALWRGIDSCLASGSSGRLCYLSSLWLYRESAKVVRPLAVWQVSVDI